MSSDFDKWFFSARDPDTDLPYGTHLIYNVCASDPSRFEEGCRLLEAAFNAGKATVLETKSET